ncbi:MAG: hypothetical protein ACR2OB_07895 [Solirubrobacteraceae bacterium]
MKRSIGRRIAAVVGAGAILTLTVAAGADALSPIQRHYAGRTAQTRVLTITLRGGRITYNTRFRQSCYTPANVFRGYVFGMVHIERRFELRKHPQGRFSLRFSQGATNVSHPQGQPQYFTAVYTASGRLRKDRASGIVTAVSTYHTLQGTVLGTCRTGPLIWAARRIS